MNLVLGVKRYDFINKDSGERISGAKITYLDEKENNEVSKGYFPITMSISDYLYPLFKTVPGIYDLNFRMKPDSKGRPVLVLEGAEFKKEAVLPA